VTDTEAPALVLYSKPGCHLCDDTRALLDMLIAQRATEGLAVPVVQERDITTDPNLERAFFETIPVVEIGARRLELAVSGAALRRFLDETLGGPTAEMVR
jgi:hypothetical protein